MRALLPAAAAALVALTGCAALNSPPPVDLAPTLYAAPVATPAPGVSNGAIFQAGQYRPLFEDHRARLVGDTLTVRIVEKVSASQKSTSSVDKTGTLSGGITALPGTPACGAPDAAVSAHRFWPFGSSPAGLTKDAMASCPTS